MNVTIYFRKEVWDKLQHEPERSALINGLLEEHYEGRGISQVPVTPTVTLEMPISPPVIAGVVRGSDFVPKPPDPETGYPCCLGKRPCKHWQWDSVNGDGYINSLTGKKREVML